MAPKQLQYFNKAVGVVQLKAETIERDDEQRRKENLMCVGPCIIVITEE